MIEAAIQKKLKKLQSHYLIIQNLYLMSWKALLIDFMFPKHKHKNL